MIYIIHTFHARQDANYEKERLNNLMKWGENTGEWNFEIIF